MVMCLSCFGFADAGRNVGHFMFKATRAGDLSEGTLYAVKANQSSAAGGGVFSVRKRVFLTPKP